MKGILFKPWKIKAIAANPDKEWQTRRTGGLDVLNRKTDFADQPNSPDEYSLLGFDGKVADFSRYAGSQGGMSIGILYHLKPRYLPGETVYLKESWRYFGGKEYEYQKDQRCVIYRHDALVNQDIYEWHNPRTMPAWAARYFIKITRVEACRTEGITPEDCAAEGIERHEDSGHNIFWFEPIGDYHGNFQQVTPQEAFFSLYDSINGRGAHERNWDWKYSFIHTLPTLEKELKSK